MPATDGSGVKSTACPVSVEAALQRLVALLDQRGLELFTVIDHSGAASEVGLDMPDTKLVLFGNPKGGTPLMLNHPLLAIDLPLKLLIWQDREGAAWVSFVAPEYLADRYGLTGTEVDVVRTVETIAASICAA